MKILPTRFNKTLCKLLCASLITSTLPLRGQDRAIPRPSNQTVVQDVQLRRNNTLQFHVLDSTGQSIPGASVDIEYRDHRIAQLRSDENGRFVVSGLRPGVHIVRTEGRVAAFRFWGHSAAPPSAIQSPAVVLPQTTIRGQYGPPPVMGPALVATGVAATALAVVLIGKSSASNNQPVPASSVSGSGSGTSSSGSGGGVASP